MADDTGIGEGSGKFPATRHSAVLAAQSASLIERERGLSILVAAYWKPIYKYLRIRHREANEEAKDLTQGFFARALEKEFFAAYDPDKGSFRTYLRTCLDRYVANERKAALRQKRSPGAPVVPLDFELAEGELARSHPPPTGRWSSTSTTSSSAASSPSRSRRCARSAPCAARTSPSGSSSATSSTAIRSERLTYERLAEELHLPVTQVTNFLAFARREFRRIVLEKLREITTSDREFREEARSLLGVSE